MIPAECKQQCDDEDGDLCGSGAFAECCEPGECDDGWFWDECNEGENIRDATACHGGDLQASLANTVASVTGGSEKKQESSGWFWHK